MSFYIALFYFIIFTNKFHVLFFSCINLAGTCE